MSQSRPTEESENCPCAGQAADSTKLIPGLACAGSIEIALPDGRLKRIGITRAHLEEDAGKLTHSGADQLSGSDYSLVDYNRAGVVHSSGYMFSGDTTGWVHWAEKKC